VCSHSYTIKIPCETGILHFLNDPEIFLIVHFFHLLNYCLYYLLLRNESFSYQNFLCSQDFIPDFCPEGGGTLHEKFVYVHFVMFLLAGRIFILEGRGFEPHILPLGYGIGYSTIIMK